MRYFSKRKGKGKLVLRIASIFFAVIIILINPFPVVVSASSDFISSAIAKLNIPEAQPQAPAPSSQSKIDIEKVKKYMSVEAAFLGLTDNVSINFKDLSSGQEFSVSPDKSWIPASIIKAYVAAEAFHQRHEGLIDFDTEITIKADNVVPNGLETDEFPRLREGTKATIWQLVQAMIIQSDNTAYNTMLDVLDRRNVMAYIRDLGIENTIVGEKLNVDDNQQRRDSTNPGYQSNVTTSADLEKLFDLVYAGKVPDSEELLSVFKRQKYTDMIPALLPPDTVVAHKNGEWAPIYHDGGIVYKPDSPFILSIFSNANSTLDVAKLAQVAYYQDAVHVDTKLSKSQPVTKTVSSTNRIYLAETPDASNVLAAATGLTSPVTAADLGITLNDLQTVSTDQTKIPYTLITPASLLYPVKIFIENFRYSHATDAEKADLALSFARERLSEMKSVSGVSSQSFIQDLNNNFQDNLKNASTLAEKSRNKDQLLLESKQLSTLHFMVLGASVSKVSATEKETFINDSYKNLVRNDKEIVPIVKNSPLALAPKTEPVVGIVQSVSDNVATITLDNGKTAQVVLDDTAKVRSFNDNKQLSVRSVGQGDKIAVIGKKGDGGKIIPVFVMKNVPKVIPKTQGVVIEIQPQANIIKIENSSGNIQDVKVDESTTIQSKDTGVSLEGIKTGSVITVVAHPGGSDASPSSSKTSTSGSAKNLTAPTITNTTITADRVTVVVNGSGKSEQVEKKPAPKQEKKENPPPPAVQPKKEEKQTQPPSAPTPKPK